MSYAARLAYARWLADEAHARGLAVHHAERTLGSSSAISACGAARLGLRVAFVGVVGDDEFGRFTCRSLRAAGLDVSSAVVDSRQRTGLNVILSRGADRAIRARRAEQVPLALLRRARHLHVASYFLQTALQPRVPALFQQSRDCGLTTSLDTNWDPQEIWAGRDGVLPRTDIFQPNRAGAPAITRTTDLDAAVANLGSGIRCGAVKLGADGALAWHGSQRVQAAAVPVEVVDTVGAADSFDAGFVCGLLSTRAAGATAAQPTLPQAMRCVREDYHDPVE